MGRRRVRVPGRSKQRPYVGWAYWCGAEAWARMAPRTPRAPTRQGIADRGGAMREGIYVVDADGHVMDLAHICYKHYLPPELARRQAYFPSQGWDRNQFPNGDRGRNPATPQDHLADNDQEGIDLQILYPTLGLSIGEIREPEYQAALCRAYNN